MLEMLKNPKLRYISKQMEGLSPEDRLRHMQQYVGVVPLYQLMAVNLQLEEEKLKQIQPPSSMPQTTVAQDLDSELAQLEASRGMGIAALPNPAMGNAQFAGGGIVAFEDGGDVDNEPSPSRRGRRSKIFRNALLGTGAAGLGYLTMRDDEEQPQAGPQAQDAPVDVSKYLDPALTDPFKESSSVSGPELRQAMAAIGEVPNPQDFYGGIVDYAEQRAKEAEGKQMTQEQAMAEDTAMLEKMGIGKARDAELARIQKAQEEMGDNLNKQKWMDWFNYFAAMGQQANQPGATLLSSAAGAMPALSESRARTMENYQNRMDKYNEKLYSLNVAKEDFALTRSDKAAGKVEKLEGELRDAQDRVYEAKGKVAELEFEAATQRLDVNARLYVSLVSQRTAQSQQRLTGEEALKQAYNIALQKGDRAAAKQLADAIAEVSAAEQAGRGGVDVRSLVDRSRNQGQGGAPAGPYAGFSATEER